MAAPRPNWLAGEDVTTPANDRRESVDRAPPPDTPTRGTRTGRADPLVFLAAVWLVVASVPVAYGPTGRFDIFWNDAVVGIAVGVVTMTRLIGAGRMSSTAGINCALGGWLVAAPFVLGYGGGRVEDLARWNDIAIGAAIVALTLANVVAARVKPRTDTAPGAGSPGLVVGAVDLAD